MSKSHCEYIDAVTGDVLSESDMRDYFAGFMPQISGEYLEVMLEDDQHIQPLMNEYYSRKIKEIME